MTHIVLTKAARHQQLSTLKAVLSLKKESSLSTTEALNVLGKPELIKMPRTFRDAVRRIEAKVPRPPAEKKLTFGSDLTKNTVILQRTDLYKIMQFLSENEYFRVRFHGQSSEAGIISLSREHCSGSIVIHGVPMLILKQSGQPPRKLNLKDNLNMLHLSAA